MNRWTITFFVLSCLCMHASAQQTIAYNLTELLEKEELAVDTANHAKTISDAQYANAISLQKIAWLKNVSFSKGIIDVDLRGKDVFLQSFLGIAFHASDTGHYELIYFRPFNFQYPDTARQRWSLQYMYVPDYEWDKLRKEHPLVYENSITTPPNANAWFHATIHVTDDSVAVYVNRAASPSLKVARLVHSNTGMIGLWDDELSGDFANLTITQQQ